MRQCCCHVILIEIRMSSAADVRHAMRYVIAWHGRHSCCTQIWCLFAAAELCWSVFVFSTAGHLFFRFNITPSLVQG